MANETITFGCPACGIKLTVPSSLAGVVGPCPSCRTQIQAPIPAPPVVAVVPTAATPPPVYPSPLPEAPPIPNAPSPQAAPEAQASTTPAALKPEPRQLPNRPHPEVVAKPISESARTEENRKLQAAPLPRHPHKSSILKRVALLLLFLIASGALVFGVLQILNAPRDEAPHPPESTPSAQPAPPPAETTKPVPAAPDRGTPAPALPTLPPNQPPLVEPPPALPDGVEAKSPGMDALAALERFVSAKSLAERLPMIETKTPEAELAASCLAAPLPAAPTIVPEYQETHSMEQMVDFYYSVTFQAEKSTPNKQTVLVRTRGSGDPKVVADPFLDLYGGRLAAYAAQPTEKSGVFQVIVDPIATCLDPKIPDREKKLTLKLLSSENTKEIALAFFGRMSKIGQMLEDGTQSLSYGKPKACTVMLNWNTKDDPKHPFLEAVQLKALDWNP